MNVYLYILKERQGTEYSIIEYIHIFTKEEDAIKMIQNLKDNYMDLEEPIIDSNWEIVSNNKDHIYAYHNIDHNNYIDAYYKLFTIDDPNSLRIIHDNEDE